MDDISHHQKFTTNTSWEPYTIAMEGHHHHLPSFAHNNYENLLLAENKEAILNLERGERGGDHQLAEEDPEEELGAMKEMMFKIAAMQPVDIDPATIRRPRRRNVRISDDPQSVAARHRRERISEKIRILQRLVPGGTKMDTASMLDEAIRYVKFLKRQIRLLQAQSQPEPPPPEDLTTAKALVGPSSYSYLFDANDHVGGSDEYPVCFNRRLI